VTVGRRTEGGGRRMEDGGWRTEDGGRRMENGERKMEKGGKRKEKGGSRTETGGRIIIKIMIINMDNKIEKFEDLLVWQEGVQLSTEVYNHLKNCTDFGFRDQIRRASVSIPSNIAEGYDRQTNKEYIQFLFIAKGSCAEVRTQLYVAINVGIIPKESAEPLLEKTRKISAMLTRLIKTRKEKF
jgi:four helix bundle protein